MVPQFVRADLLRGLVPLRLPAATQTAPPAAADSAGVAELVAQCAGEYEAVAEQQRRQLAGLQSVLSGLRRREGPGEGGCMRTLALADALTETVARAAARDANMRDAAIRKYIQWMHKTCESAAVSCSRDRGDETALSAPPCARPSFHLGAELQRAHYERQLRVVFKDCRRLCDDARVELSRAVGDAALAREKQEAAAVRYEQIEELHRQEVAELQKLNEKQDRDLKRTRLQLHTARRNVHEQYWELKHAEPLARELNGAAAAATAAGVMPSQIQAELLLASGGGGSSSSSSSGQKPPRPYPPFAVASTAAPPVLQKASPPQVRSRRCSAPNILETFQLPVAAAGGAAAAKAADAPWLQSARRPLSVEARSWAPEAGPRSDSVVAVVHALSGMQVRCWYSQAAPAASH